MGGIGNNFTTQNAGLNETDNVMETRMADFDAQEANLMDKIDNVDVNNTKDLLALQHELGKHKLATETMSNMVKSINETNGAAARNL